MKMGGILKSAIYHDAKPKPGNLGFHMSRFARDLGICSGGLCSSEATALEPTKIGLSKQFQVSSKFWVRG